MEISMSIAREYEKRLLSEVERLTDELVLKVGPERIVLFGSLVSGEVTTSSDIDIIVVKDSDLTFKERMNFLYTDIERKEETDILWYTPGELSEMGKWNSFIKDAMKNSRIIYEK